MGMNNSLLGVGTVLSLYMFNSNIYGLYSLEINSIPTSGCDNQNCLQSLPNVHLGQIGHGWKPLLLNFREE